MRKFRGLQFGKTMEVGFNLELELEGYRQIEIGNSTLG